MMITFTKLLRSLLVGTIVSVSLIGSGYADPIALELNAQYFTVKTDPDFNQHTLSSYLVQSKLGASGLPWYSSGDVVNDKNANGEITWWSPSENANVIASGTANVLSPFEGFSMFPPGESDDFSGFLTAHFTGTLSLTYPETLLLTLGADDDAFFYLDGDLKSQFGGVHTFAWAATSLPFLVPSGEHTIDIFYADREPSEAVLMFGLADQPIPEPGSHLLLGIALFGLLVVHRRRFLRWTQHEQQLAA